MIGIRYNHICAVIIGIIFIFLEFIQNRLFLCLNDESQNTNTQLFIAILSARSNFIKREAIRKSWGQLTKEMKNVYFNFFIGKACSIPVWDRLDEFGCSKGNNINYALHSSVTKKFWGDIVCNATLYENHVPSFSKTTSCFVGFGFHVLHPLILTSVGVHIELLEDVENLEVIFKDPEEVLENIIFNKKTCSLIEKNFCFMNLGHQFLLPKNFEGEISLSTKREGKIPSKQCFWDTDDCLRFTFGKTRRGYEKYQKDGCSYIIGNFVLSDKAALNRYLAEKTKRHAKWLDEQRGVDLELKSEAEKYGDVIYLPSVIDVYRNLPLKVLEILKWAHKNYASISVLKVDDDTYVNAALLTRSIAVKKLEEEGPSIWSHFHYHRAVPLFGKWSDPEFRGLTYPPFPSGSGYLVSGIVVSLLSQEASVLRPFQGEDISIGIWTEVLYIHQRKIQKHDVSCWLPFSSCNESFIIPELTPQQMIGNLP